MARAGETPEAQFKGLAYGENTQANDAAMLDTGPPLDPGADFTPSNPSEQFLYGPTNRPNEPVTAGAPVGPGTNFIRGSLETPQQTVQRVATQIAGGPDATPIVKQFAARILAGE